MHSAAAVVKHIHIQFYYDSHSVESVALQNFTKFCRAVNSITAQMTLQIISVLAKPISCNTHIVSNCSVLLIVEVHCGVCRFTENLSLDLRSWCPTWRTMRRTYRSSSRTQNGDELELAVFFFTTSSRWLVCLFTQNSTTTFDFCLNLNGQFLWVTPGSAESFWELLKQDFYRPSGLSVAIPTTSEQWRANSVLWC